VVVALGTIFDVGTDNVTINGDFTLVEASVGSEAVSGKVRFSMRLYTNETVGTTSYGTVHVNGSISFPFNSTLIMRFEDGEVGACGCSASCQSAFNLLPLLF
jgi:hypothetical protein